MSISIRALQERVDLVKLILDADEQGGFQESWKKCVTTWAKVTPLYTQGYRGDHAKGIRLGGKEIQSLGYKVMLNVHYKDTEFQRVVWRDKILALTTQPESDETRRYIIFYASALQSSERKES